MSAVLGTLLRCQWRLWLNAWRPESRIRPQAVGTIVAVPLFMAALFGGTFYFLSYSGLQEMFSLGEAWSIAHRAAVGLTVEALSMASTTTFLVICLSALEQAFETYFRARDLALLLSAPIPRKVVFAFKFLMNMRWDATMVLVTAMPIWLAFAVWLGAPAAFYLALVVAWMLLLILVSGLGTMVAMALARFISGGRLRQILLSFLLSVGLLFVIVVQGLITGVWGREGILRVLEVQFLTRQAWLPPVWLSRGLVGLMVGDLRDAWPWLAGLGGAATLSFAAAHWVSMRLYGRGWSHTQEAEGGSVRSARERQDRFHLTAGKWALVRKDLTLFVRQPMQWYQAVLGTIAMVMVLLNFLGQQRDSASAFMLSLVMGYVGASTFAMNLSLRGVTREGICWWILQVSPLSEKDILRAKFGTALIPTTCYACLALAGMHGALRLPWFIFVLSAPVLLSMVTGMIALDLAVGLWRADFQRASETRNADVAAVLVSQLLNYVFLSPGLFLLSLPSLTTMLGAQIDLPTVVLASAGVFLPLSALVVVACCRYSLRALRALRLSEQAPPLQLAFLAR